MAMAATIIGDGSDAEDPHVFHRLLVILGSDETFSSRILSSPCLSGHLVS
jgi:hypothetical protein